MWRVKQKLLSFIQQIKQRYQRWSASENSASDEVIRSFQPTVAQIESRPLPPAVRALVISLGSLFLIALLWACLGVIDTVVMADGEVVTATPTLGIDSVAKGEIEEILVVPGQAVSKGQALVRLEPTFTETERNKLNNDIFHLQQKLKRLALEEQVYQQKPLPETVTLEPEEKTLLQRNLANFREKAQQYQKQQQTLTQRLQSLRSQIQYTEKQVAISQRIHDMHKQASETGASSKRLTLEAEQQLLNGQVNLQRLHQDIEETQNDLARNQAEQAAELSEKLSNLSQERIQATKALRDNQDALRQAERVNAAIIVRSPVDAHVLSLDNISQGTVVEPSARLLTLVPDRVPLEIRVNIATSDVGSVRVGDEVKLKVDAYPFQRDGVLHGKLMRISPSTINNTPGSSEQFFYHGIVQITLPAVTDKKKTLQLMSGMKIDAAILTGKRRIISYILYPLMRYKDEAIREK